MATEVGRPDPAEVVFCVGNEPTHGVVAAAIAKTTVGGIDPVIHEARAVRFEVTKPRHRAIDETAHRAHPTLPHPSAAGTA